MYIHIYLCVYVCIVCKVVVEEEVVVVCRGRSGLSETRPIFLGSGSSASGVQDRRQRAQTLEERRLMKITEGGGLTPLQSAVDRISWLERLQGDWERHDMEHAARKRMVREHRQRLEQVLDSCLQCAGCC